MKQKRSLGQVFLQDEVYVEKILRTLVIENEDVLEIGSGKGQISIPIAQRARYLWCVEIDSRLCHFLTNKFSQKQNVEIINTDILTFSLSKLSKELIVFGNVPYQISSELIKFLVSYRTNIKRAYLTFQKEFAKKLFAQSSSEQYSFISCFIQYYGKLRNFFNIPAGAFSPHPKVDSTFMEIEFYRRPPYKVLDEVLLFKIIRKAFSNRRKKVINSLNLHSGVQISLNDLDMSIPSRAFSISNSC